MPTYEYHCLKCKKRFEQIQKITAPALKKCVHCGGKAERLISANTGFIFKGSGFYITDYKKKSSSEPVSGAKTESKKEKTDKPSPSTKKE